MPIQINMDASMVQGFIDLATEMLPLMGAGGAIIGLYLIGSAGAAMLKASSDGRSSASDAPIAQVVAVKCLIGAMLLTFHRTVSDTVSLVGGAGSGVRSTLAYVGGARGGGDAFWGLVLKAAFLWLAVVGVIAIFRGLLLWVKAGSGQSSGGGSDDAWSGFWHVLAGGIAINLGT